MYKYSQKDNLLRYSRILQKIKLYFLYTTMKQKHKVAIVTLPIIPVAFYLAGCDLTVRGPELLLCYIYTVGAFMFIYFMPEL